MLEFNAVCAGYGEKQVLKNVSFQLRPHRLTALVGRNGSGKSTLLACVNQQIPYSGEIRAGEKNLALLPSKERAKTVAILPQMMPTPHVPVKEMVAFGRNPYLDFTGRLTETDKAAVEAALADASALDLAERYADTLSGGELQRVRLGMILAQNTPIALLDEPTAHMDQTHEAEFLRLLTDLKERRKKTFLVILHDLTLAAEYADDFVVLDDGKAVFFGTKEECLDREVLEKTFGLRRYTVEDRIFFAAK